MLAQGTDQLVAASSSGYPRFSATDEWQAATPFAVSPNKTSPREALTACTGVDARAICVKHRHVNSTCGGLSTTVSSSDVKFAFL